MNRSLARVVIAIAGIVAVGAVVLLIAKTLNNPEPEPFSVVISPIKEGGSYSTDGAVKIDSAPNGKLQVTLVDGSVEIIDLASSRNASVVIDAMSP